MNLQIPISKSTAFDLGNALIRNAKEATLGGGDCPARIVWEINVSGSKNSLFRLLRGYTSIFFLNPVRREVSSGGLVLLPTELDLPWRRKDRRAERWSSFKAGGRSLVVHGLDDLLCSHPGFGCLLQVPLRNRTNDRVGSISGQKAPKYDRA
jgi:hypothetical protein